MPPTHFSSTRRLVVVFTVALCVALLALAALAGPSSAATATGAAHRARTTVKAPTYVSALGNVQAALDRCRGPVAWNSAGEGAPWLLFEHDYCGGTWVLKTRKGAKLKITAGSLAGTWRANGKTSVVSRGALVSTTRGLGYLVVQTCIPGTQKMKLVGFDRG